MKSLLKYSLLLVIALPLLSWAQDNKDEKKKPEVKISGFAKNEMMYDSRQTLNSREGLLVYYPLNQQLDKNGKDINAHPNTNILAMTARLNFTVTGPDVWKAKATAVIEGDFTGPSNADNNGFRLRHAYTKLKWEKSELIAGQYWHPLNVPEMIPYVISLNTGAPFHPFSRQPQLRFSHMMGKINLVAVASADRDYTSIGPSGATSDLLKNSVVPNMHLQIQYKSGDNLFGIGGDYKKLTPRLKTDSNLVANESLDCMSAIAFAKFTRKTVTVKLEGVLGQNLYEHMMIGGFGISEIDTATNRMKYSTLNQLSAWTDISYKPENDKYEAAIFIGYLKNLGSLHNIISTQWGRGSDVAYCYRVAPRFIYKPGVVNFAFEIEYTVAAYGKANSLGDITDSKAFANIRGLFAVIYNF